MRPRISKILLMVALLALIFVPAASHQTKTIATSPALARMYEVRLRKLHLVRPDLIAYPMFVEVYC